MAVISKALTSTPDRDRLPFGTKLAFGFVAWSFFFAGIMLDVYVDLPFNAVPGQLEADVLTRIGVTAGPLMGIAAIISLLVYGGYSLHRERHQQILKSLEQRY